MSALRKGNVHRSNGEKWPEGGDLIVFYLECGLNIPATLYSDKMGSHAHSVFKLNPS